MASPFGNIKPTDGDEANVKAGSNEPYTLVFASALTVTASGVILKSAVLYVML